MIGHTQPRRIAARRVAERIAEELGTELGDLVGYQVRFTDRTSQQSRVKLMTDGILLAELQHDRMLAHTTRSSSTRPTSAASTSTSCSATSGSCCRGAPTSSSSSPRRRSTRSGSPRTSPTPPGRPAPDHRGLRPHLPGRGALPAAARAARPTRRASRSSATRPRRSSTRSTSCSADGPGDILVFLPGEREIRDTADALRDRTTSTRGGGLEIVPLYSRLSAAEQHRVFERHTRRRVVLATNVAETSLTVPGIRYVIDTGAGADQPLVGAHQGAAPAHRADQPGLGQAALGPLRPRRGGHRDPALQRGGLRGATGVHRARDPAHQPGHGHPPDDLARSRRGRAVPVRRPAGHARGQAGVQLLEELGALAPRDRTTGVRA